jgi:hypothetical protein
MLGLNASFDTASLKAAAALGAKVIRVETFNGNTWDGKPWSIPTNVVVDRIRAAGLLALPLVNNARDPWSDHQTWAHQVALAMPFADVADQTGAKLIELVNEWYGPWYERAGTDVSGSEGRPVGAHQDYPGYVDMVRNVMEWLHAAHRTGCHEGYKVLVGTEGKYQSNRAGESTGGYSLRSLTEDMLGHYRLDTHPAFGGWVLHPYGDARMDNMQAWGKITGLRHQSAAPVWLTEFGYNGHMTGAFPPALEAATIALAGRLLADGTIAGAVYFNQDRFKTDTGQMAAAMRKAGGVQ